MVNNMPIFWNNYFLVIKGYGSKWPPPLIKYGWQMNTDQNMSQPFSDRHMIYLQNLEPY